MVLEVGFILVECCLRTDALSLWERGRVRAGFR
jgi:hypothetical protein